MHSMEAVHITSSVRVGLQVALARVFLRGSCLVFRKYFTIFIKILLATELHVFVLIPVTVNAPLVYEMHSYG